MPFTEFGLCSDSRSKPRVSFNRSWVYLLTYIFISTPVLLVLSSCSHETGYEEPNRRWYKYRDGDTVIVFVHGILSDSISSWTSNDPEKQYWPKLVFNDDRFGNPAIYLGGYYTKVGSGRYDISDAAKTLFDYLTTPDDVHLKIPLDKKNVVFVAHSTGGIIVRDILANHPEAFAAKNVGLVLLASPGDGSKWANRFRSFASLFGNEMARQLERQNEYLDKINAKFRKIKSEKAIPNLVGIDLFESKLVFPIFRYIPFLNRSLVVDEKDTELYFQKVPTTIGNSDHFSIAKPTKITDESHVSLYKFFNANFSNTAISSVEETFLSAPIALDLQTGESHQRLNTDDLTASELEDYFGQIFIVGFPYQSVDDPEIHIGSHLIDDLNVGGIVLLQHSIYAPNENTPRADKVDRLITLTKHLQDVAHKSSIFPLFIATDHEGGSTAPLTKLGITSSIPAQMAIASTRNPIAAKNAAIIGAMELHSLGFNMNFAPVLDALTSRADSVINDRSYSSDLGVVTEFGEISITESVNNQIIPVVKHFPGHGGTKAGFHSPGLATSDYNARLMDDAIYPFRQLTKFENIAVMTSHFTASAVSSGNVTFDKEIVEGILRGTKAIELPSGKVTGTGFEGLVVADNLLAPSITGEKGRCEENLEHFENTILNAAIKTFESGHDLLMFTDIRPDDADPNLLTDSENRPCARSAMTISEFYALYYALRKYIFRDSDPELRSGRIEKFRRAFGRIVRSKAKLSFGNYEHISPNNFFTLLDRNEHQRCLDQIYRDGFVSIQPVTGINGLHLASRRDKVFVLMPSRRGTYESIRRAKSGNDRSGKTYAEILTENVNDFDWTRELNFAFGSETQLHFEMDKLNPSDPSEWPARAKEVVAMILAEQSDYVILLINKRYRWQLAQHILAELSKRDFPLQNVSIVVTTSPNILRTQEPIPDINSTLKKVVYLIGYSGFGHRASLFFGEVRSGRIYESNAELPIRVANIAEQPSFLRREASLECQHSKFFRPITLNTDRKS